MYSNSSDMPSMKRSRYSSGYRRPVKKRKTAAKRRITRYVRKGKARPSRALSTTYRGAPNQYRFVRETRPTTIDMGAAGSGVSLIAGTGAIPDISVFEFPNFEINQLPGFTDFSALFANYKVDKIETVLIPQWQETVNPDGAGSGTTQLSNLVLTRINTKYLPNGITLSGTAEAQRDELAQIMKKTRSMYGSRKWLKINTSSPDVPKEIPDGAGGTNLAVQPSPWLPTATAADQRFQMNDILFADRTDGKNFYYWCIPLSDVP